MIARMTVPTRWAECRARGGLVAAPHALAAEAGAAILRRGGNAVDAAIAAGATIAVVYPHMNGVGGDSFWLIFDAGRGSPAEPPPEPRDRPRPGFPRQCGPCDGGNCPPTP